MAFVPLITSFFDPGLFNCFIPLHHKRSLSMGGETHTILYGLFLRIGSFVQVWKRRCCSFCATVPIWAWRTWLEKRPLAASFRPRSSRISTLASSSMNSSDRRVIWPSRSTTRSWRRLTAAVRPRPSPWPTTAANASSFTTPNQQVSEATFAIVIGIKIYSLKQLTQVF